MLKSVCVSGLLLLVMLVASLPATAIPESYETLLPNGLRVIMIPDSRAEMAVSYVVVNAGVRHETPDVNGVTHLLEHLLFNGTETRTQEQLYEEADFLGAYNNAFTRKDFTAFMILAPSHTFPDAFALQADMILHSTLPPEKLEKERGIVNEEINQSLLNPAELVDQAWAWLLWQGTPYEMPVLGPQSVIAAVPREKVWAYYQTHYAPNNMTLLLIGDFAPRKMLELVQKHYAETAPREVPPVQVRLAVPAPGLRTCYFENVQPSVRFALPLPQTGNARLDADAHVVRTLLLPLLEERLGTGLTACACTKIELTLAEESFSEGGYITGSFTVGNELEARMLADKLPPLLADAAARPPDAEWLAEKQRELIATERKQYDNFLYYGMFKSYLLAQGRWELARDFEERLAKVSVEDVQREMVGLLSGAEPITMVALPYPEAAGGKPVAAAVRRLVLDNGLTALLRSDPRSEIFGAAVLFRNRSFAEPPGKCGLAELWQHVLAQGPAGVDEDTFSRQTAGLGLSLEFTDNPYIPMDDMYLSPRYSFIKAEGLDESWRKNLELLAALLAEPKLTEEALAEARRDLLQVLGMKSGNTLQKAREALAESLLGGHPLARPVQGVAQEVASARLDDLRTFAATYGAGGNIILSVVSGAPVQELEAAVRDLFAALPAGEAVPITLPVQREVAGTETGGESPQAGLAFGYAFSDFRREDLAALTVLGGLISERVAFAVREVHGLAYSVGGGFDTCGEVGWLTLSLGTAPENVSRACAVVRESLAAFQDYQITRRDRDGIVNSYLGRRAMRRITRKNQAFFAATAELLGGEDDAAFGSEIQSVTVADLVRVRERYFHPEKGAFCVVK